MNPYIHPRMKLWLDLGVLLFDCAERSLRSAKGAVRERRRCSYKTRRPGADSPLWNVCAEQLRDELKVHGAKARLARFLGIPRQRLQDFLKGSSRLPDAELTLQMLNWLALKRSGRDISL